MLFSVIVLISSQKQAFSNSDLGTLLYTDLKFGLNGRTYPIGAQITGNLGVAYPLWGDTQTWKYGYVRAGLNIGTSAVVNRAGLELQVFPISILGVTAGYDSGVRNFTPRWLDCATVECNGRVDRKYLRLNAAAAYNGFSLAVMARYENIRGFNSSKLLFDEVGLLLTNPAGENTLTLSPALLYRVNEKTNVGFASLYSRAIDTGGYSHLYGPVVAHTLDSQWNGLFGIGLNSSPVVHSGICAFFMVQYTIKPSLSVLDLALRAPKVAINPDVSESPGQ